ncbi:Uma2 family endonuclease [Moraxella lacunata]|nr:MULTISPECIES: Uma2 family endonuclease [Moraxella]MBE9579893.1 Uma2 family endonuclease [Moraxella sp. K1664]MDH9220029.1 Uma2 family endonuclease [Moraxella lacunata]
MTTQEFLAMLQNSDKDKRTELINGQMVQIAPMKPRQAKLIVNCANLITTHLYNQKSSCFCFTKMICKIDEHNCPQPDILVVCNDSVHGELLAHPTVVGEIFSSNRSNDMKKLARYKKCPSIFEILMIEQNKMQITLHKKTKWGNGRMRLIMQASVFI